MTEKTPAKHEQDAMTLAELVPGTEARIVRINGNSPFKKRLLEMGLLKGEMVHKVKLAPLADPAEYVVKGYHVSLRRGEARDVIVEPLDKQQEK